MVETLKKGTHVVHSVLLIVSEVSLGDKQGEVQRLVRLYMGCCVDGRVLMSKV